MVHNVGFSDINDIGSGAEVIEVHLLSMCLIEVRDAKMQRIFAYLLVCCLDGHHTQSTNVRLKRIWVQVIGFFGDNDTSSNTGYIYNITVCFSYNDDNANATKHIVRLPVNVANVISHILDVDTGITNLC
jgi:hypothetical protein